MFRWRSQLTVSRAGLFGRADVPPASDLIVPSWEISAYEALWTKHGTVKKMADVFRRHRHPLPSTAAMNEGIGESDISSVREALRKLIPFSRYSALFFRDFEYPERLRAAKHPIEVVYYRGALDLLSSKAVSVVGTRKPTEMGVKRAAKLARFLVAHGYTVVSGLAEGVDTAAHRAAIGAGGQTIGVIGTPLNESYPRSNKELQEQLARDHLLISQTPFYLTSQRTYQHNRAFFPERNKTMSALSLATVIVEASDTSGTLFQAKAAIQQGRRLFILKSCFDNGASWPTEYLSKGATKVVDGDEIIAALESTSGL